MRSTFREMRAHPRVKMILPVDFPADGAASKGKSLKEIRCESMDLSLGGARLISDNSLDKSVGENFGFRMNLPPCYSSDPRKALPVDIEGEIKWTASAAGGKKHLYGIKFLDMETGNKPVLNKIIVSELDRASRDVYYSDEKPLLEIKREVHACNMYAADLSVGCQHDCIYCHFAEHRKRQWLEKFPEMSSFPIGVDLSPLYSMKEFPSSVIYLSPSSDAFAPNAREAAHELLEFMLPRGATFTISTKNVIPERTLALLKRYSKQIEGVAMGITNLDPERNSVLEPGCPSAEQRLRGARRMMEIGCGVSIRMDPIFPLIDDSRESMERTVKAIHGTGIRHISGTYVFTFGSVFREMSKHPYLAESMKQITEKSYPIGGKAISVSKETKRKTYALLNELCRSLGMVFMTCGCKDTELRDEGYSLICRNMDYYDGKGNTVD